MNIVNINSRDNVAGIIYLTIYTEPEEHSCNSAHISIITGQLYYMCMYQTQEIVTVSSYFQTPIKELKI